ncbi:hypothetical protein PV04_01653 [Phialophora macrospora]|uniref:F-box domain-containing protein n=1 Tax=Phialophora macrospora TaxID=1851006 RepID=A0A0D2D7M0_9EURO|nr:hypothetical protein PV04_01653 [Phialophora macrospora]
MGLYAQATANKAKLSLETGQWLTLALSASPALNCALSRRLLYTEHNLQLGKYPSGQHETHFISMVPANADQHRSLFDLPNVVIRRVMEELAEQDHLSSGNIKAEDMVLSQFRLTCRDALYLAEPARWKYIDLSWDARAERIHLRPDRIKSSLDADERRLNWVQNLNVRFSMSDMVGAAFKLQFISRFPNLKSLTVGVVRSYVRCEHPYPWLSALQHVLDTHRFPLLRECFLNFTGIPLQGQRAPRLEHLLQAPKLTLLALDGLDLRGFQGDCIPQYSASLARLKLARCVVDERSMSTLLSKPRNLQSLDFCRLEYNIGSSPMSKEQYVTQLMLAVISRTQPGLNKLKIHFDHSFLLERNQFKSTFDLGELSQLKKLSITAEQECVIDRSDRDRPGDYGMDSTWRPTNLIDRLPAGLEQLKLKGYVFRWGVDLEGLADDLLRTTRPESQHGGRGILESLRRLKLVTTQQNHCRPLNQDAQARDDKFRRGIDRLMAASPMQELTCTQSHRLPQDPGSYNEEYFIRRLRAKKTTTADADIESGGEIYDLEELTEHVVVELEGQ